MLSQSFIAGGKMFCSYCGSEMINCECDCAKAKKDIRIQHSILLDNEELRNLKTDVLPKEFIRKIQIVEEINKLQEELKTL